jgi:uncharacterized lipoprotein
MKLLQPGLAALAILLLAGCGRGQDTPGQPTADERRSLDNAAAKLDENAETFDTSPDSLVPAEGSAAAANDAAPANAAAPAAVNAAGNEAAPR